MAVIVNPLDLPLLTLPGEPPMGVRIAAEQLAQYHQADALIIAAQRQAEAILAEASERAEACKAAALADADTLRTARLASLEAECQQARTAAVDAAVTWLCHEEALERKIATALAARWRHWLVQALSQLLAEADQTHILLHKLEQRIESMMPCASIRLYASPQQRAVLQQTFATQPQIEVVESGLLTSGQAQLDNGLVRITLDLPSQQQQLLALLAQHLDMEEDDGVAN